MLLPLPLFFSSLFLITVFLLSCSPFFYYHSISHVAFLLCRKTKEGKQSSQTKQNKKKKKTETVYQGKKKKIKKGGTRSTAFYTGRRDPPSILVKKKKNSFPFSPTLSVFLFVTLPNRTRIVKACFPLELFPFFFSYYHSLSCAASFSILL